MTVVFLCMEQLNSLVAVHGSIVLYVCMVLGVLFYTFITNLETKDETGKKEQKKD